MLNALRMRVIRNLAENDRGVNGNDEVHYSKKGDERSEAYLL